MLKPGIRSSLSRRLLTAVCVAAIGVSLAGCASKGRLTTGSIPSMNKPLESMNSAELSAAAEHVGRAYDRNPKDATIGMHYASVLTMGGRSSQALAVMQQVAIHNPTDRTVLAAYGKALAGGGQFDKALDAIRRAQTPDRPDWQLLSAEGAILDQMGDPGSARDPLSQGARPQTKRTIDPVQSRHVLSAARRFANRRDLYGISCPATWRGQPCTAESGIGRRPSGPFWRSREDRQRRVVTGAGHRPM
jgi:Tfp pilus assembly protein PilF